MISVFGSKVGEEEIREVSDSINKQWMGMGPKVKKFEELFAERINAPNRFLMVDSGSNALYLAVTLLDLPPASEIIVPTFTWVSCAQAVLLAGHVPVFCDIDPHTMNVTADLVKDRITDKTAAVMVVHYAGLPVEMDEITALGFPVIEDAAHAVDSEYKGKTCGTIGDIGIYSFDAVKNLAVGEGGGICSRHKPYIERARRLRYCGIEKSGFEASSHGKDRWWEYSISEAFIKMNPSDISGAMGVAQLKSLDQLQSQRKKIWDYYQDEFTGSNTIQRPVDAPKHMRHSYFTYCIRGPRRDELAHFLLDNGVYSTLRYHPLHMNALYKQTDVELKHAEKLNEDALSIPLHPNMSLDDAETVVRLIKRFYK